MSSWFPRPKTPRDIFSAGTSLEKMLPAQYILELLQKDSAEEWRDRVGVTGFENGSQKTTTRLLCSGGWVFKTHTDMVRPSSQTLVDQLYASDVLADMLQIWHPLRFGFILRAGDDYWPCTASPLMKTLHEVKNWTAKTRWWIEMLRISLDTLLTHQVLPDIRMSNFGFTKHREHLHYLGDEVFEDAHISDIGEALGMFPALQTGQTPQEWHTFGREINAALRPYVTNNTQWEAFVNSAARQLLGAAHVPNQHALVDGLNDLPFHAASTARPVKTRPRICVLADVHANLPALDAVLQRAAELNATHYLFLGDAVGYGPHPQACIQRLGNLPNLIAVQGNHDYWTGTADWQRADEPNRLMAAWSRGVLHETEICWLLKLLPEQSFSRWFARHGAPSNPDYMFGYVDDSVAADNLGILKSRKMSVGFFAHTHLPALYSAGSHSMLPAKLSGTGLFQNGMRHLVNPGAVGQPRDGDPRAAFAIWDRKDETVKFYRAAYPVRETIAALKKMDLPEQLFTALAIRLEQGR